MIVMLPFSFALFVAHFEKPAVAAALTLVIFLTALPLLGLPGK
jgi:hypothetical protein